MWGLNKFSVTGTLKNFEKTDEYIKVLRDFLKRAEKV